MVQGSSKPTPRTLHAVPLARPERQKHDMNPLVPDFILAQETRGRTEGNFAAAALFIDIPGFTRLTEQLAHHEDRVENAKDDKLVPNLVDEAAEEVKK